MQSRNGIEKKESQETEKQKRKNEIGRRVENGMGKEKVKNKGWKSKNI